MTSLRRQLTLSFSAVLVVVALVAGVLLRSMLTDALVTQFDFGLRAKAGALAALLEIDGPVLEFDADLVSMPEYNQPTSDEAFRIWKPDGSLLARSRSLPDLELPRRVGQDGAGEVWDLTLPDGRAGRALGLVAVIGPDDDLPPVASAQLPRVSVVVSRSRAGLDEQLAALGSGLAAAFAGMLVLGWWGVGLAVRRGLRPVQTLGATVAGIDEASLDTRLGAATLPDELQPLAGKLDELLARLESAFARQQRMTAAMAHELRTPIAELRSATDIARRWPDDPELVDEAVATADHVAGRMSASVDAVMHYCRLESGQDSVERHSVHLHPLVEQIWDSLAADAADRGVTLDNQLPEALCLDTDGRLLGLVLRNLLDNAASFSSPGRVRIGAGQDDGSSLFVENPTEELSAADLAQLTEPFWRKDSARSDAGHSGLGLTLVCSVARALGLEARFELLEGRLRASLAPPRPAAASPRA